MGETDRGKRGLVLMGGAMFSKSLIQFCVDEQGYVPSLLFDLSQTMMEVMKIMVTSFKRLLELHGAGATVRRFPTKGRDAPARQ